MKAESKEEAPSTDAPDEEMEFLLKMKEALSNEQDNPIEKQAGYQKVYPDTWDECKKEPALIVRLAKIKYNQLMKERQNAARNKQIKMLVGQTSAPRTGGKRARAETDSDDSDDDSDADSRRSSGNSKISTVLKGLRGLSQDHVKIAAAYLDEGRKKSKHN